MKRNEDIIKYENEILERFDVNELELLQQIFNNYNLSILDYYEYKRFMLRDVYILGNREKVNLDQLIIKIQDLPDYELYILINHF